MPKDKDDLQMHYRQEQLHLLAADRAMDDAETILAQIEDLLDRSRAKQAEAKHHRKAAKRIRKKILGEYVPRDVVLAEEPDTPEPT